MMDLIMKIKSDATELNKQIERSSKILADAAKKSQVSIQDVGKAFARINTIDYNIPITSFSSHTANNPNYWKKFNKEMNQMNYEYLKRDNTVYRCSRTDNGFTYLFRFINDGDRKLIINCDTSEIFDDCTALQRGGVNTYRLANLEEQCRFYNEFGYKDAKGRVWKVGDNNPEGDEIAEFEAGSESETIWTKSRHGNFKTSWRLTHRLNEYEGKFPVKNPRSSRMQDPRDILREAVESSQMSINQCREALNLTKPEKVHWFKRFIRKLV